MAAYHVERFEVATKEIFGSDFCSTDIKKLSKPNGEYDAILELSVDSLVDSDRAGEICTKFDQLLERAPAFAKVADKIDKTDGTFLVWFVFEDVRPYDLEQRLALFCYDLDPEAPPVSVLVMRDLGSKYNCHLQR